MQINEKKIYITGVSGFIGSRLAKLFLAQGYKVVGLVRRLGDVVSKELGIEVIEADLNDSNQLKLETAQSIIHCATANDIVSKNSASGFSLSVLGTNKILEASCKAGIPNIVFFSTAQIYGTELNGKYNESSKINCETAYAANHYLGEEICKFYSYTQGLNITIMRPSNIYGVPEISTVNRKTLVPMCFVNDAINNDKIILRSSGNQKRNFISIDQLFELILKTIDKFPKGFTVRNCGSNLVMSMLDVTKIISNKYQSYFKKNLPIIIESKKPEISNEFEYNSEFFKYPNSKKECIDHMENIIDSLFQLWTKN